MNSLTRRFSNLMLNLEFDSPQNRNPIFAQPSTNAFSSGLDA